MTLEETEEFNAGWLDAWTAQDVARIALFYSEDCLFMDSSTAGGLKGRAALIAHLDALFPRLPDMTYSADTVWLINGGFCGRWFCDIAGGARLRGFDLALLRGREIVHNEVYTHNL